MPPWTATFPGLLRIRSNCGSAAGDADCSGSIATGCSAPQIAGFLSTPATTEEQKRSVLRTFHRHPPAMESGLYAEPS